MENDTHKKNSFKKRIYITCIYTSSPCDWQGCAAGIKNLLKTLSCISSRIDLISYSYHSDGFRVENKKLDELIENTIIHLPSNWPRSFKAMAFFPALLYSFFSSQKCNIIFADASVLSATPAIILGKILNKPIALHYLDQIPLIPERLYKYIICKSDIIFAISPYLLAKAKHYGCSNVIFLPSFVNTDLFSNNLASRKEARSEMGISDDCFLIAYVGSFWEIEGIPVMLRACKELLKNYKNIRILIMGKKIQEVDEDIPSIVKDLGLSEVVVIIPPQPNERVPYYLSACDVTCCPKLDCEINRAANPIKVIEYLSMGIPTVCSAVGGITDAIEHCSTGILVKPGDVNDLSEKIEWVILNPVEAKQIGMSGRSKAIQQYSIESVERVLSNGIYSTIYPTQDYCQESRS